MNKAGLLVAVPLVAVAFFIGLKVGQGSKPGGASQDPLAVQGRPGTPVATFDGQTISGEELKARIEEQNPFVRIRHVSPDGKKEFLQNMVRLELLAREAHKKGYDRDPELVREQKQKVASLFVQREFEEPEHKVPVDEAEMRKFYDDHKDDYVKPERVRVAHIFIEARDAEAKQKRRPAAEAALAEARGKDPFDFNAFHNVVRLRSEDAQSRQIGGDLHYLSREELAKKTGQNLADLAFTLRDNGKLHPELVETEKGFHVLKLLGRESSLDLKYEDVKESIRNRVAYDRRTRNYQKFVADLEQRAGLKIDQAALEKVQINLGAPTAAGQAGGPPNAGAEVDPTKLPPAPTRKVERPGAPPPGADPHGGH